MIPLYPDKKQARTLVRDRDIYGLMACWFCGEALSGVTPAECESPVHAAVHAALYPPLAARPAEPQEPGRCERCEKCQSGPAGVECPFHCACHARPASAPGPEGRDDEQPVCRGCGDAFDVKPGYEPPGHGMCWPCASTKLDELLAAPVPPPQAVPGNGKRLPCAACGYDEPHGFACPGEKLRPVPPCGCDHGDVPCDCPCHENAPPAPPSGLTVEEVAFVRALIRLQREAIEAARRAVAAGEGE